MWSFVVILCFLLFLLKFISIVTKGRCKSNVCLVGKTALIVGGNSGIGLKAAYQLASRGCRVIIADKDDATESKKAVIKETHNPKIEAKLVDFKSFKSVRAFAKDINKTETKLDIFISNVGIGSKEMILTEDGLPRTLQVNYFSHFLLAHLLIDLLKKSAPSRIIFTSSLAAYIAGEIKVSDLTRTHPTPNEWWFSFGSYADSKLLLAMSAVGLSKKLEGTGVTVNALHPGVVDSQLFQKAYKEDRKFYEKFAGYFTKIFGKTIEEGAQTLIHLACENKLEKVTGKFFIDCTQVFLPFRANDGKFCEEIWKASEKVVKLEEHEKL